MVNLVFGMVFDFWGRVFGFRFDVCILYIWCVFGIYCIVVDIIDIWDAVFSISVDAQKCYHFVN